VASTSPTTSSLGSRKSSLCSLSSSDSHNLRAQQQQHKDMCNINSANVLVAPAKIFPVGERCCLMDYYFMQTPNNGHRFSSADSGIEHSQEPIYGQLVAANELKVCNNCKHTT
jgi:hypothetical protein